jgi:hydrogenase maturation protein HypF
MVFADRADAGRRLADQLVVLRDVPDVLVVGLPRGGVPVAREVADAVHAPLDVMLVRKLGVPGQSELAMGAIGEGGVRILNDDIVAYQQVSAADIEQVAGQEWAELRRRAAQFRGDRPPVELAGKIVVVVDDGLATGATARAACQVARQCGAARVVLAVPVAPHDWVERMGDSADEYVCVDAPRQFFAVGNFYDDFAQTSDAEVVACLRAPDRPPTVATVAQRVRVRGVVQGVGFRPFVHGLASSLGLVGSVGNDDQGVIIHAEGPAAALDEFVRRVRNDAPPLASVTAVEVGAAAPSGARSFTITASAVGGALPAGGAAALPPDTAVCAECVREMFDPADRRYRHPFITCTNCGPRFTIAIAVPYDRSNTTMASFELCPACAAEYQDPGNRRFHAQPVSCHDCGPRLELVTADGSVTARDDDAVRACQELLDHGAIVAVKGIGGYHLVCDATNDDAVARLRRRKRRGDKPLAVMVADLDVLHGAAEPNGAERGALLARQRPIVLLRRIDQAARAGGPTWPVSVAGRASEVGVMLPYAPVHLLLFDGLSSDVLVCTSGNVTDEPIVVDDTDALSRLGSLADAWLRHDRPIHRPCDDSVIRVVTEAAGGGVMPVRRSRGWVPLPVDIGTWPGQELPGVLALGGDLKNVVCVAAGRRAWLSQHLGDLGELPSYEAAQAAVQQLLALTRVLPSVVAVDAHPGYLSGRLGRQVAAAMGLPVIAVQHHHAHVVSALAEWRLLDSIDDDHPAIGFAFDGTGYGPDGSIWGGEVLLVSPQRARRVGHLAAVPLPGGDAAIERPSRVALAHLWAAGAAWDARLPCVATTPAREMETLRTQLEREVFTVPTSSMGRLFDAVAALAGVRQAVTYEAQAAIELQATAEEDERGSYRFPSADRDGAIDSAPVIRAVVDDVLCGVGPGLISTRFHRAVAEMVRVEAARAAAMVGTSTVVLSGGVFQNAMLATMCTESLVADGFDVHVHRLVPTNDGGLALGQAVVAGARFAADGEIGKD